MENKGHIEIRIVGSIGSLPLNPNNYDIKELKTVLDQVEQLLFPIEKRDRPLISYQVEEGSVLHIFRTSAQIIIGFNAILSQINLDNNIDFLEPNTAKAIEVFQDSALKKDYQINIKTSLPNSSELKINNSTNFKRTDVIWVDSEFYFYGKITDAGGKKSPNIHINSEGWGTVTIETPQDELEKLEKNILYKTYGVRAIGRQNPMTGELDKSSLKFIQLIDYNPKYDKEYLASLRNKANRWLSQIDPDRWLQELRGGYDT